MRTLSPAFATHLQQTCTTLAMCWILKREDNTVLGFTDHDEDINLNNVSCRAETGLQPTQAVSQLGFGADNVDVAGALNAASITEKDIEAGLYDNAQVTVWLVNWSDPSERVQLRTMIVGEVTREDHLFRAELRGLTALLDKQRGRSFIPTCDTQLGDAQCGINLNASQYSTQGSVGEVFESGTFSAAALSAFADGWFSGGTIRWLTGANANTEQRIGLTAGSSGERINLWELPPEVIAAGDTFRVFAGCDKRFQTCKSKFSNSLNFRGFPQIPGNDFAMNYAANGTKHDGSPLKV